MTNVNGEQRGNCDPNACPCESKQKLNLLNWTASNQKGHNDCKVGREASSCATFKTRFN